MTALQCVYFANIQFFYQILSIVKKKVVSTLVGLLLLISSTATAQSYLATKTLLDSVKVNKLHGTAEALLKIEQTDNFKVELDANLELIYAFNKHKLRFAGNVAYNTTNIYDNGNKGFFYIGGDFFQFNIDKNKREKTKQFFSVFATYQYDYCRDLHDRAMLGVTTTWQPLREHPNMFIEPSVGLMAGMQYWRVIKQPTNLDLYNNHLYTILGNEEDVQKVRKYVGTDPAGYRMQWDTRAVVSVHFGGEWDRIAVNAHAMIAQPLWPQFKADPEMDALLGKIDQYRMDKKLIPEEVLLRAKALNGDAAAEAERHKTYDFEGCMNPKALPLITAKLSLNVRIWNKLSSVTRFEFLWDGGQVPTYAYNLTYCFTQGLSYSW